MLWQDTITVSLNYFILLTVFESEENSVLTSVFFQLNQLDVQPGQRVLLRNVAWDEFEKILSESGEHRVSRLAYYQGTREIMVPLPEHENTNKFIETLINALVEKLDLNIKKFGSSTLRRADVESGAEPDSCYYIQNELFVRSSQRIDLQTDPPPDLVVEIDVTSSSTNKRQIYAALRVLEFWRYRKNKLQVLVLDRANSLYIESSSSPTFPILELDAIPRFLALSLVDGEVAAVKAFRYWIRDQLAVNT